MYRRWLGLLASGRGGLELHTRQRNKLWRRRVDTTLAPTRSVGKPSGEEEETVHRPPEESLPKAEDSGKLRTRAPLSYHQPIVPSAWIDEPTCGLRNDRRYALRRGPQELLETVTVRLVHRVNLGSENLPPVPNAPSVDSVPAQMPEGDSEPPHVPDPTPRARPISAEWPRYRHTRGSPSQWWFPRCTKRN